MAESMDALERDFRQLEPDVPTMVVGGASAAVAIRVGARYVGDDVTQAVRRFREGAT